MNKKPLRREKAFQYFQVPTVVNLTVSKLCQTAVFMNASSALTSMMGSLRLDMDALMVCEDLSSR